MSVTSSFQGTLTAITASPSKEHVAVAGKDILGVFKVCPTSGLSRLLDLKQSLKQSSKVISSDIKWNPLHTNIIASATTSGAILLWDVSSQQQSLGTSNLTYSEATVRVISEHTRAINKLSFHCTDPEIMISGSQDGLVKLWDNRTQASSRLTFDGHQQSCRDVQFAPHSNSFQFAGAYENGCCLIWDIRTPGVVEKRISAHSGVVLSLDWHANGSWIATGGRDKMIQIWDTQGECRKPMQTIQCVQPVSYVKWRPDVDNSIASYALSNDTRCAMLDFD